MVRLLLHIRSLILPTYFSQSRPFSVCLLPYIMVQSLVDPILSWSFDKSELKILQYLRETVVVRVRQPFYDLNSN